MSAQILLEEEGPLARITLQSPGRNTLTLQLQSELRAALAALAGAGRTRLLVLRGAGGSFCSGAALNSLGPAEPATTQAAAASDPGAEIARQMEATSNPLITDLQSAPFTTLAVVEGAAAGAGASLALATDLTLASEEAFFLLPFAPKLGLVPDLGASHALVQRLGPARAMGLALLGNRLSAAQAEAWGLIWESCPQAALNARLDNLINALLQLPPGMAPTLRHLFAAAQTNALAAQMQAETDLQSGLLNSAAFEEGCRAFLQKRSPDFYPAATRTEPKS